LLPKCKPFLTALYEATKINQSASPSVKKFYVSSSKTETLLGLRKVSVSSYQVNELS